MKELLQQRSYWVDTMHSITEPVWNALSKQRLRICMPVEQYGGDRSAYAYLEAFGRTFCGIASWIELQGLEGEEEALRKEYERKTFLCLEAATNPTSPDYMNFNKGAQPLVDTAFLAHGLIRAKTRIIDGMEVELKKQVTNALRKSRSITPYANNWLLFSAMVETALYVCGEQDYDLLRVKYAVRTFMQWYKGDGIYGDGENLHVDYYNSFVIIPMLLDIVSVFAPLDSEIQALQPAITKRACRSASILERFISPEGTYPIVGRSVTYRFGAFHLLSQAAKKHLLSDEIHPAQVRCALTAVIKKIMDSNIMDEKGWLKLGIYGSQPGLAEEYICTGSLYLCCTVFLVLGLSSEDVFWSSENRKWTACKILDGEDCACDHSI